VHHDVTIQQCIIAMGGHGLELVCPSVASTMYWPDHQLLSLQLQLNFLSQVSLIQQELWDTNTLRIPNLDNAGFYCTGHRYTSST
jgi:hypothetical protein